jgi:hypothetical protein
MILKRKTISTVLRRPNGTLELENSFFDGNNFSTFYMAISDHMVAKYLIKMMGTDC